MPKHRTSWPKFRTVLNLVKISDSFFFILQDKLIKCVKLIKKSPPSLRAISSSGPSGLISSSLPRSPSGVLDAGACLSYRSDDSPVGSCLYSSHYAENTKRRKLS